MNLDKLSSEAITELNSWLKTEYNINLEEQLTTLEELETLETYLNLIKFDKKLKLKTLENNRELSNKLVIENAKLEEKLNKLNLDITEKPELNNLITELSVLLNNFKLLELNSSNLLSSIINLQQKSQHSSQKLKKLNLIEYKLNRLITYNNFKFDKISNLDLSKETLNEINLNNTQLKAHLKSLETKSESYNLELNHNNSQIPFESIESLDIPSIKQSIAHISSLNSQILEFNDKLKIYNDLPPNFDESKYKLIEMEAELDLLYLRHEQLVNNLTAGDD